MPFTIPNTAAASYGPQAGVDSGDLAIMAAAAQGFGVVGGFTVSAQATPNMTVAVTVGVAHFPTFGQVAGIAQTATITTANGTNPRHDVIVVDRAGVVSVVAGTPAAVTTTSEPVFPAWPAGSVVVASVYVPPGVTAITNGMITDKRLFLPHDRVAPISQRVPWLWPFRHDSPWNLPVASSAIYEQATDPITANIIAESIGGQAINPWINWQSWNIPIFLSKLSDPLATVTDTTNASRSDIYNIPTNAAAAAGGDATMTVISPDGRIAHNTWVTNRISDTSWTVQRHEITDLHGTGFGPSQGISASGAANMGGVIREWETHGGPDGWGEIRHALYVQLDSRQLLYSGNAGYAYDGYGYGGMLGYTWPATEQDYDSSGSYSGLTPIGTLCAVPPWVDLTAAGFTPAERVIARAAQIYGLYVNDRSTVTFALEAEHTIPQAWIDAVWNSVGKLRPYLRRITNNTPTTPGGGRYVADGSNRIAPLAPPLAVPQKTGTMPV